MKRYILSLPAMAAACIFVAMPMSAHDFESGGLFFNITSESTCEVTHPADDATSYSGDITIPASVANGDATLAVTAIGQQAFANAQELKSISIPASVTRIGKDAFANDTRLKTLNIENLSAWCTTEFENMASNPMHIRQYSTSYDCALHINGTQVTDITIPDDVEAISPYAFVGCRPYGRLTFGNNLKTIGTAAFSWGGFKTLEIGTGLQTVGIGAFSECGLTDVCVSSLSHWCRIKFLKDPNVLVAATSNPINKPDAHPTYSPRNLIIDGERLTNLVIPDDVTEVDGTFCGYAALESVVVPDHVTSLTPGIFQGCENLVSASLGEGLSEIPAAAFSSDENLTQLHIGSNVATIGQQAFSMCYALPQVAFPKKLHTIKDQAFVHCRSITGLDFPEGLAVIEQGAFGFCSALEYINLPESVETIGFAAFYPNSVVRNVRSYSPNPPALASIQAPFSPDTYKLATLSVPEGAKTAYSAAPGWKNFTNIEENLPAAITEFETTAEETVSVRIKGLTATFINLPDNATYRIHDLAGRHIISGCTATVTLPAPGIYIISVAGSTIKIAL